ncbi:5190_t:CDS:2, partial [Acaulospora colombiana]
IIQRAITSLNKPDYKHVIPLFSPLNEPRVGIIGLDATQKWYLKSYEVIRNITNKGPWNPWLIYSEGLAGLSAWRGFMKGYEEVALDVHEYLIFDPNLMRMSQEDQFVFPCAAWGIALNNSLRDFGLTFAGEWSATTDDCALYLNGVGGKAAYEGSCANSDISNNLHNAVTKAAIQKALTNLVEKDEVGCKTYGKQSVYVVRQDQFESPSAEELNEMDMRIEELKKEVNEYKDRNKQLQSGNYGVLFIHSYDASESPTLFNDDLVLNGLNNSLTNEQIMDRLDALDKENEGYEERLKVLRSGSKQISAEDKKRIDELYEKNRKLWKQRKRMFNEVFNQIVEATEKKAKDFMEELGIEMDPIDINEDPLKNL